MEVLIMAIWDIFVCVCLKYSFARGTIARVCTAVLTWSDRQTVRGHMWPACDLKNTRATLTGRW